MGAAAVDAKQDAKRKNAASRKRSRENRSEVDKETPPPASPIRRVAGFAVLEGVHARGRRREEAHVVGGERGGVEGGQDAARHPLRKGDARSRKLVGRDALEDVEGELEANPEGRQPGLGAEVVSDLHENDAQVVAVVEAVCGGADYLLDPAAVLGRAVGDDEHCLGSADVVRDHRVRQRLGQHGAPLGLLILEVPANLVHRVHVGELLVARAEEVERDAVLVRRAHLGHDELQRLTRELPPGGPPRGRVLEPHRSRRVHQNAVVPNPHVGLLVRVLRVEVFEAE
mmetsp:Transcript_12133/g.28425  ORF Transcript_12133/g.28425 Transcript_12133/m.28425 type:complete len:285 (+) Transcript_12133:402-1256(+)